MGKTFDIDFNSELAVSTVKSVGKTFNPKKFVNLVTLFERQVNKMVDIESKHQVKGSESEANAVKMGTQAKRFNNAINSVRMDTKRPYLDFCNELDGYIRPVQKKLTSIENSLKRKVKAYRLQVKQKQEEAARKAREIEEENKSSELKMPAPPAPNKDLAAPVRTIDAGSAHFQNKKKFILEDITKVPAEYLMVDWKKVKAAEKKGIVDIPGMKLVDDIDVSFRQ